MAYVDKVMADGTLRDIHDAAVRNMIAPTQETNTASKNYAKGEYLIFNDT